MDPKSTVLEVVISHPQVTDVTGFPGCNLVQLRVGDNASFSSPDIAVTLVFKKDWSDLEQLYRDIQTMRETGA